MTLARKFFRSIAAFGSIVKPDGRKHAKQNGGQNGDVAEGCLSRDSQHVIEFRAGLKRFERGISAGSLYFLAIEDSHP